MKTVAQMASSVHEIVERALFRPALASIVHMLLGGITAAGSVVLSEVLRPQVSKEGLHAAEQRVSHALKHETALDTLPDVYLAQVAPVARTLRFRSIDGTDLSKPAGRHFECLDVVRDGSCKPRERVVVGPAGVQPSAPPPSPTKQARNARKRPSLRAGARPADPPSPPQERKAPRVKIPSPPALKKLGYWMIQIEAGDGMGNHLPLFQTLYSTQDPDYQALGENAWTLTYQRSIERVFAHAGREGTWLLDRGFDAIDWMNWLHVNVEQNIIRVKANRFARPGTKDASLVKVAQLAETLKVRSTTQIRYVDKSTHEERFRTIPFTWAPIWIDGVSHPLYLIVAHTGRKKPLLLVTDRRPECPKEAGLLIQAYLERWGNEEVTRACKQLTGLERIRVRSLPAMRRLLWCAMIAVGLQAFNILTHPRWARATLDRAKEFIEKVRFVLYRVWRVVKEEMRCALEVRPRLFT